MQHTNGKQAQPGVVDVVGILRDVRDVALLSCAKVVLTVTSSPAYARTTSTLAKPALIVAALTRRRTETAMGKLLPQVNMPSRDDVTTLARRLTNIEVMLDDLSATLETVRTAVKPPPARPARRAKGRVATTEEV